ncbi:unknown [Orgyia pseudotsugata multiple nucleopolyhedrovirus]|uniref:Uncharacterized protein n=1 Tax=Orgyia pseudotsugata multicapsid polyhedrosis virus TaxID=262177 RepID=O10285_NPVOP|nr:hypothetical protein OpmnVgp028 [Orgyia pseudotsugata multiple nucleopolyhedrovirus]AAC59027.1 unknown [Orgyia pseudotsugata multiple nucleopolyhedrovirus]
MLIDYICNKLCIASSSFVLFVIALVFACKQPCHTRQSRQLRVQVCVDRVGPRRALI